MAKMLPSDVDFQVIVAIQMHNADLDHSSVVMVSSSLMICSICDKVHCTVKLHCRVQYNGNGIRVVVSGCHLGFDKNKKKD